MIDDNKWSGEEVLVLGVLRRPIPDSKCPYDAKHMLDVDEEEPVSSIRPLLIKGPGVATSMYYGCWSIWKQLDGLYAGELMQYRNVTDSFADQTLDEAMEKAAEWFGASLG